MMRKIITAVALLILGTQWGCAETLSGTVTDDGEPMPQADVTLVDADSSVILKTARTDAQGVYRLTVAAGRYNLRVSAVDYADEWVRGIVVNGADRVVDVAMTPSAFVEGDTGSSSDDCE